VCANRRKALITLLFSTALLYAEDTETAADKSLDIVPLSLLYRAAMDTKVRFSPDWDMSIPTDAFLLHDDSFFSKITLSIADIEYTLSRTPEGRLEEFPFFYNGVFTTVRVLFDAGNNISGFTITIHESNTDSNTKSDTDSNTKGGTDGNTDSKTGGDTKGDTGDENKIDIEFLQSDAAPSDLLGGKSGPRIARIHNNDAYFFVSCAYSNNEIIETYFSEEGSILFLYRIHFINDEQNNYFTIEKRSGEESETARSYYDSMGYITGIVLRGSEYRALYNNNGVRYWEQHHTESVDTDNGRKEENEGKNNDRDNGGEKNNGGEKKKKIQYDGGGLAVRETISGIDGILYIDYQYKFDSEGNWIERQATQKKEILGVLITVDESIIKRTIIY
jgi:hypothetical protein